MSFMAKYIFPVLGVLLFGLAGVMLYNFVGRPLPVEVARTVGLMMLLATVTFVASALVWDERRSRC